MPETELFNHCKELENFLIDEESSDINAIDLANELSAVCTIIEKNMSPREVLKFITALNFGPNFALKILLTLPISVASGERSFSKFEKNLKKKSSKTI